MTPTPRDEGMKPCPFCGTTKLFEGQGEQYFIECEHCYDTFGTTVNASGDARHDAIAMWNRRADSALLGERDQLKAENERLRRELRVVAEAIWQNVNRDDMRHWAQGISVSISGDNLPAFAVTDDRVQMMVNILLDSRSKFSELYVTLATEDLSLHDLRELRALADQGGLAIDAALSAAGEAK